MKTHRFEMYRDRKKEWRWRLTRIRGGKIIADSSEGYVRAMDARRQITALLKLDFYACDFVETR
jgi:uncharacterized protein YegP (UPF0339 family)